jgi:hypothetical protein
MRNEDQWQPDHTLALTVRTRSLAISALSAPDRAWIVASLTAEGWTVAAIADRLSCSLRLIQQIKAEPMTIVARYALNVEADLRQERAAAHIADRTAAQAATAQSQMIARLTHQRDVLLDQVALMLKTLRTQRN